MVRSLSLVLAACGLLLFSVGARADKPDYSALSVGDEQWVDIDFLHPTQFRVGAAEVREKAGRFEGMGTKELRAYLKAHPCPVVIGPGGVPYITDEQHRANASFDAEDSHHAVKALRKRGQPQMNMKIIDNLSSLSTDDFEKEMLAKHYTYLYDRGDLKPFSELPRRVFQMKNDPYRSVAGFLERIAWDLKPGIYFEQFTVAQWLRENLKLSDQQVTDQLKNHRVEFLKKVMKLLQSPEAKSQEWYLGPGSCEVHALKKELKSGGGG
ncbi:MAG: ParB/Srx family N-terminal domain-containing protein [Oligoflexia bacterium]|nr:ParB/Srx family N-terminal domain-containing protein [Oligoflexia bacterium]